MLKENDHFDFEILYDDAIAIDSSLSSCCCSCCSSCCCSAASSSACEEHPQD